MKTVEIIDQLQREFPQYEISLDGRREIGGENGMVMADHVKIYDSTINVGSVIVFTDKLRGILKPDGISSCGRIVSTAIEKKRSEIS